MSGPARDDAGEREREAASGSGEELAGRRSASTEIETRALIADLDPFSPTFASSSLSPSINSSGQSAAPSVDFSSSSRPETDAAGKSPPRLPSTYTTLGANVQSNARLELISDDEEEDDDGSINPQSPHFEAVPASLPPKLKERVVQKVTQQSGQDGEAVASGSGGFLGGMFRSGSGQGTSAAGLIVGSGTGRVEHQEKDSASSGATPSEYNEKSSPTSASQPPSNSSPTSPRDVATGISNPLASISSIFRSARSSPIPSPSHSSMLKKGRPLSTDSDSAKGKSREKDAEKEPLAEIPFDFNKFLEQMRSRSAEPIAKYLRSFLKEFSRRPPISSAEQIRIINDFLDFIAGKMRSFDPWKVSLMENEGERGEAEFDMALEAMEKLVMNRLWHLTFTPAIDLSTLPQNVSPTDDLERDHVLGQRIRLFAWIQPCHLDLPLPEDLAASNAFLPPTELLGAIDLDEPPLSPGAALRQQKDEAEAKQKLKQTRGFLDFAQKELNKINQYKAPRDKLICVLNSCKVIFGLIRHISSEEGADAFIPLLIYVVLKANPEHLVSNLQYIQRFRNPEKLSGEGGYYLSSLNGAISFIETLDATSLSKMTQDEFETNVAKAIESFPRDPDDPTHRLPPSPSTGFSAVPPSPVATDLHPTADDSQSPSLLQRPELSFPSATKAISRLTSKPLDAIGRILDQLEALADGSESQPRAQNYSGSPSDNNSADPYYHRQTNGRPSSIRSNRSGYRQYAPQSSQAPDHRPPALQVDTSSSYPSSPHYRPISETFPQSPVDDRRTASTRRRRTNSGLNVEEVTLEIDRQHEQQRLASIETLVSIFPQLEREVLEIVLLSNMGNMAASIDALLEMS